MRPSDVVDEGDRVALFVDSANITHAARDLGFQVDWARVVALFRNGSGAPTAFFYVATRPDDNGQREFLHAVAQKGFIIRSKPLKEIRDQKGHVQHKGNLDIEIALDMVAVVDNYEVAFLFSGDSDFRRVVEVLQDRGKRVHVVSARDSLSEELLEIANKPVFLIDEMRAQLEMD